MTTLKVTDLGDFLKEQRQHAKLSLRQLAEQAGVSNPYLSQVERGLRRPSAEVLQQIAKGLRISAEALYVRAGILEERGDRVEVEAAVLADPGLTERQRRVLLDIYQTFRTENEREPGPADVRVKEAVDVVADAVQDTREPAPAASTVATGTRAGTKRTARKQGAARQTTTTSAGRAVKKSAGATRARKQVGRAEGAATDTEAAQTQHTQTQAAESAGAPSTRPGESALDETA